MEFLRPFLPDIGCFRWLDFTPSRPHAKGLRATRLVNCQSEQIVNSFGQEKCIFDRDLEIQKHAVEN